MTAQGSFADAPLLPASLVRFRAAQTVSESHPEVGRFQRLGEGGGVRGFYVPEAESGLKVKGRDTGKLTFIMGGAPIHAM